MWLAGLHYGSLHWRRDRIAVDAESDQPAERGALVRRCASAAQTSGPSSSSTCRT